MKKTGAKKHHQSTVYSLEIKVYLQMAVKKHHKWIGWRSLFSYEKLLKVHNGFAKSLKLKMVDDYLLHYKKK